MSEAALQLDYDGAALVQLAFEWMRRTEQGKGIRLVAEEVDLLNVIGVGDLIAKAAADYQRQVAIERIGGGA